jgi:hypothetical protein
VAEKKIKNKIDLKKEESKNRLTLMALENNKKE